MVAPLNAYCLECGRRVHGTLIEGVENVGRCKAHPHALRVSGDFMARRFVLLRDCVEASARVAERHEKRRRAAAV